MAETKLQKVSEWLWDLGSHDIYKAKAIAEDFVKCTGITEIPWRTQSAQAFADEIEAEGRGGGMKEGDPDEQCVAALDIAYVLYGKYAGDQVAGDKFGRGSQFREYVSAIERNGN